MSETLDIVATAWRIIKRDPKEMLKIFGTLGLLLIVVWGVFVGVAIPVMFVGIFIIQWAILRLSTILSLAIITVTYDRYLGKNTLASGT